MKNEDSGQRKYHPLPENPPDMRRSSFILLWLLCASVWFLTLDVRDVAHPDEGRYSEISREMAQSGDWVTPRLDGLKYFEKPPLQYWATAAVFKVFGITDFTARLWVGLCGLLALVLLWRTARRLWDEQTAVCAAAIGAGSFYLGAMSHIVTLDMGVSFFLACALCGFVLAHRDAATPMENRRYMWLTWAAMAGAVLSKGLIGLVLPGAVLVLYGLICRDWRPWARMHWFSGGAIFLALAAPWHLLVASRNPEWAQFYFVHEHFQRFLTNEAHREGAWYYFVPILLAGMLPWTGWLPQALRQGWQKSPGQFQLNRFLLIWSGFIFVFFSASGSKLPGYVLPVVPALVLLLAPVMTRISLRSLRIHATVLAVFWIAIAGAAPLFGSRGSERTPQIYNLQMSHWLLAGGICCAALCAAAAWNARRGLRLRALLLLSASGLGFLSFGMYGYQAYAPLISSEILENKVLPQIDAGTPLFSVGQYEQTLPFYFGRTFTLVAYTDEFALGQAQEPDKWIPTVEEFSRRWRALPQGLAVMEPSIYRQLLAEGVPMKVLDETSRRVTVSR